MLSCYTKKSMNFYLIFRSFVQSMAEKQPSCKFQMICVLSVDQVFIIAFFNNVDFF